MPGRHSPNSVVEKPATAKLKRPKNNGVTRKEPGGIQHLLFEEADSQPRRPGLPKIDNLPVKLEAPVDTSPPTSTPEPLTAHRPQPTEEPGSRPGIVTVGGIDFHHESEAEFARLLNYYGIEWLYEPHQFPLVWREGRPTEMFSPDFYLVEYDFYIELTTMRQSLVRKKNRKLRL